MRDSHRENKQVATELENEPWVSADDLHTESILLLSPKVEQKGKSLQSAGLPPPFLSEARTFTRTRTSLTPILTSNGGDFFFFSTKCTNPGQGNLQQHRHSSQSKHGPTVTANQASVTTEVLPVTLP